MPNSPSEALGKRYGPEPTDMRFEYKKWLRDRDSKPEPCG